MIDLKITYATYIASQDFYITADEPTPEERRAHAKIIRVEEGSVTDAFRTALDDPYGQFLEGVLDTTFGEGVVQIRIMGGTVPIAPFINALDIPAFIVPMVNPDNNQHSPNENLEIGQLAYGIRLFTNVLTTPYTSP